MVTALQWQHIKTLRDAWPDIDLPDSRILLKLLDVLTIHDGLTEAAEDCGFGQGEDSSLMGIALRFKLGFEMVMYERMPLGGQ